MDKRAVLYDGDVIIEFNDKEHAYTWNEKFIPGVTSILKVLNKPALMQWSANMSSEHFYDTITASPPDNDGFYRISAEELDDLFVESKKAFRKKTERAADIGSAVHNWAEAYLKGEQPDWPEDKQVASGASSVLDWLSKHDVVAHECERIVFSRDWYYAGTCDVYGGVDGERAVVDFKTSKASRFFPYPEHKLQLCAYAIAIEEERGFPINTGWIVRLDKETGVCEPHKIALRDVDKETFLRVKETYEGLKKLEEGPK